MAKTREEQDREQENRDMDELMFRLMNNQRNTTRRKQMENPPTLLPLPLRELDTSLFADSLNRAMGILPRIPPIALTTAGSILEATFSAQIENLKVDADMIAGYHASDRSEIIADDLREAYNYIPALNHCVDSIDNPNGLPLCSRLLCEAHGLLFEGSTRADYADAGSFRTIQNYIGNGHEIVYMPPAPGAVQDLMTNLGEHCNEFELPALVQAAILHVQFESIHPFIDGNGRIGRLLIALFMYQEGLIDGPGFYLSRHFRQMQMEYYANLNKVREDNGWERWIKFFLDGVYNTTNDAIQVFGRKS